MKKILATLIIILGFWPFVRESHASISSQPLSLQELSDRSSLIVVGAVSKMESLWNPERTKIFTFIQIEVEDYIKGAERELLTVRIPGGTAEGITEVHPGGPTFVEGEKVLLFLAPGDGYSDSAGLNQGTYSILGDRVLGMGGSSGKFIHHIKALNGKEPLDFETLSELENEESFRGYPSECRLTPSSDQQGDPLLRVCRDAYRCHDRRKPFWFNPWKRLVQGYRS
jgi:hypothetical protein